MKRAAIFLASASFALALHAQGPASDATAERARISAERARIETAFLAQEKGCYRKFAVTDCVNAARAARRESLAVLRKQEVVINDAERRQRGATRLSDIEQKAAPSRAADDAARHEKALESQKGRELRAREKATDGAARAASAPGREAARKVAQEKKEASLAGNSTRRVSEAAANVQRQKERVAQAQARREAHDRKVKERTKPLSAPLPAPP